MDLQCTRCGHRAHQDSFVASMEAEVWDPVRCLVVAAAEWACPRCGPEVGLEEVSSPAGATAEAGPPPGHGRRRSRRP